MRHERNFQGIPALGSSLGFRRTVDMMTYDMASMASAGTNHPGKSLGATFRTHDGRTIDSTGAFLVGELERLDLTLHEPLAAVTWGRDIQLREDVTIADEVSSFTVSTYATPGSLGTGQTAGRAKGWIGKDTNQITRVSADIAKLTQPLLPWAKELAYTVLELESAAKLGRPVDEQKFRGLQLDHQMEVDEMVYFGDSALGYFGLNNSDNRTTADKVVNVTNVAASGTSSSMLWASKTPAEILQDFNEGLTSAWAAAGFAVMPTDVLLPPTSFGYIATQTVSSAGNMSILNYVLENNITAGRGGARLNIRPTKWNVGVGTGGTLGVSNGHDRMVFYSNDKERVRYPMTMLSKTPLQYDSIWHKTTYYGRLGVVEIVYPETIAYRDGIS